MATRSSGSSSTARKPRPFRWTRDHLTRLPDDGNRYEVLDGELLVTPQAGIGHQGVAAELISTLRPYCKTHGVGTALGPGAVIFAKNELQPDVLVVPPHVGRLWELTWKDFPTPTLVVEILSPGSERHDLVKKLAAYMRIGIPEYWVVDVAELRVLVFRPGSDEPTEVTGTLRWAPRAGIAPLEIDLGVLFGG